MAGLFGSSLLSPPSVVDPTAFGGGPLPPTPRPAPALPDSRPEDMREFGDAGTTRQRIFDNVLNAARQLPAMENTRHTLSLQDVDYAGPDRFSIAERKQAILEGRTMARRLRGTWVLRDRATQQELDRRPMTIAQVPYMTDDGTFVHNGTEYTLSNQLRLRPGAFTRTKDNGEIEAHVNFLPGKGVSHRYFLDPAKGHFYARVGQAEIPLINLMRILGASDKDLQEAWGEDLFRANLGKYTEPNVQKLYERFVGRKADPTATAPARVQALREMIEKMEFDPEVTGRTLGKPYQHLNLDALKAITKKLIAVGRQEMDPDDRDHLAYQTVHGPEDLFAERLTKDYGGARRALFNRASWSGNLSKFMPGAFTKQIESAIMASGLGQSIEEINPLDVYDKQFRISRLGEGGIPSVDSVPDEARSVQPSHAGFIDGIRTPESFKAGVDVYLASASRKGRDGRLYSPFTDLKSGQTVWKSPQDVADLAVAFPGEMARKTKRVFALQKGRLRAVPKEQVSLAIPHFEQAFSPLANLIPMKSAVKGQRLAMGSRMLTQALPLADAEAPLVQSAAPGTDKSYEYLLGNRMGALRAKQAGKVLAVEPGKITVQYGTGKPEEHELYQTFPYNRKTYLHQTPVVKPGNTVQPDQLLARSNYTSPDGVTAMGKNARVAYLPFRGMNYEDAVVISESFANKLSSEHMYQHRAEFDQDSKRTRKEFLGLFGGRYNRQQMDMIDDDGAIKPGSPVQFGDPLVLAASPRVEGQHKVHRAKSERYDDKSLTWEHHTPGIVTDVVKHRNGTTVLVKSLSPMQVGDKLSGRYGDKGVVASIVPDEEMPADKAGKPFELLLNPLGVISRANPAQVVETALGKIAAMTGKPYVVPDFDQIEDLTAYAIQELRKHGLEDTEDLVDAETGRKLPGILTGSRFVMKLHHTAEGKGQGRGTGAYTMDDQPAKGGEHGSKRISLLDVNALLSHGATGVLQDAAVRGQRNEDWWLAYMQGNTPAKPKVPLVFRKFVNELKAAGINVIPDGSKLNIMALTDKDIDTLSEGREISSGDTVDFAKGLKPIKGGLFDPSLTGGHHGNRWAYIKLTEPMPNPVMEDPIRRVLGLTQQKFEDVIAGKESINGDSGPGAIQKALARLDLPREIQRARVEMQQGRASTRDAAVRRLGYLKSAERLGLHPKDWMLTKVPVLPPMFRPLSVMADSNIPLVSDANYLYKELLDANSLLKDMTKEVDDVGDERLGVYQAFKAVTGLADPVHPKLQEKRVKGVLAHIFGSSPKFGTVQRRLLSSPVDLVGRAVITPNPDLDMDHVGLPENRAWDVYRNFIVRRLKRRGMPITQALEAVEARTPQARQELLTEMEQRPVFINRAPVLHKFGVMAFWPKLTKGETLQISPLIVKGFNADFDGDAMQYHVPVTDAARDEAVNMMLPSRNLISPSDFKTPVHAPGQEYVGGLYAATQKPTGKPTRFFRNKTDAIQAYRRGELSINTPVQILSLLDYPPILRSGMICTLRGVPEFPE